MTEPITDPPVDPPVTDPPVIDPPVDPPPEPPGDRDWIPEDLRGEKSLDAIKDVPGLTKSYVEAQKMIGGSVRIPKEGATPEEWAEFHTKMGRPDDVAGYEFVKPELPAGVDWDEGLMDWFGKTAHDAGLSKGQANKLMEAWNDNQFTQAHDGQKALGTEVRDLKDLWGDKYDGNVELGVRAVETLLPADEVKDFKQIIDSTGVGNRSVVLKMFAAMGNILKADGYIIGDGHGGALGPESAKAKIAEINNDMKHPHNVPDDPGHEEAVKEMTQLFKTAYPA